MSKTTNYQLTLWDYGDEDFSPKKAREDLAANFSKLDAALKAEETARVEAAPKLAMGVYTGSVPYGNNIVTQVIQLGFRPRIVCIMRQEGDGADSALFLDGHPTIVGANWIGKVTDAGFEVKNVSNHYLNDQAKTYHYFAVG